MSPNQRGARVGARATGIERKPGTLVVVLSNIEMGAGGVTDDRPATDFIARRLVDYRVARPPPTCGAPVELEPSVYHDEA